MGVTCSVFGHKFKCERCGKSAGPITFTEDFWELVDVAAQEKLRELIGELGGYNPELAARVRDTVISHRLLGRET